MTSKRSWLWVALSLLLLPIALRCLQVAGLLHQDGALEQLFEDDFFYYSVVARRLLDQGLLSFDGVRETNGFHPLWFVVVCLSLLLSKVLPVSALLLLMVLTSVVLPLWGAMALYRALLRDPVRAGSSTPAADAGPSALELIAAGAFSLLYGICAFQVSFGGMEVALTLALAPHYFEGAQRLTSEPRTVFVFSLLACLVVLSRLDSMLLVGPTWLVAVAVALGPLGRGPNDTRFSDLLRRLRRVLPAAALGWAPLALYLGANLYFFNGLLPESARAKALTVEPGPFAATLLSFRKAPTTLALGALGVAIMVAALLAVRAARSRQTARSLALLYACLWPALYFALLSFRSPWAFWAWYLYPVVMAIPPLAMLLARTLPLHLAAWPPALAALLALLFCASVTAKEGARALRGIPENSVFEGAVRIKQFADQHPGYYAMGDRAGMVGHFIASPVLQLEGLVGGKAVLAAIAAQQPLLRFLEQAGVDYYIGTDLRANDGGCLLAVEPAQARQGAPHMTGTLCAEPMFRFTVAQHTTTIHALREERSAAAYAPREPGWAGEGREPRAEHRRAGRSP